MLYLSFADYKERSSYEASEIDTFYSGTRANTYAKWERGIRGRKIDDKLRRRYAVPFGAVPSTAEPDPALVPEAVKEWMVAYLDARLMRARRDPGSEAEAGDSDNTLEAQEATAEIERAANANEDPHGELPLRATDPGTSGVVNGGPIVVSYQMPWNYQDRLARERQ
jgi:hypothetical protein